MAATGPGAALTREAPWHGALIVGLKPCGTGRPQRYRLSWACGNARPTAWLSRAGVQALRRE